MKKVASITELRIFTDVVDGPGWTDVEVDGYYAINGMYVQPQYRSSPTPREGNHTATSR
jgi:hypothetical protein